MKTFLHLVFGFGILLAYPAIAQTPMNLISVNLHCQNDAWRVRYGYILDEISCQGSRHRFVPGSLRLDGDGGVDFLEEGLRQRGWNYKASLQEFSHVSFDRYKEYVVIFAKAEASNVFRGKLPESPLQRSYVALKVQGTWFVNLHLEYRDEWASYRGSQVRFLVDKFKSEPVVLMGDWNSQHFSDEQSYLRASGFRPIFPGESFPSRGPNVAIDGFWFGPAGEAEYSGSGSLFLGEAIERELYPSDHLGIQFKSN